MEILRIERKPSPIGPKVPEFWTFAGRCREVIENSGKIFAIFPNWRRDPHETDSVRE